MIRTDGRAPDEMRPVAIERDYIPHAEGSALIKLGNTRVLCVVTYEDGVPAFLKGSNRGWVTAEYSMLPRATNTRSTREAVLGRQGGRSMEIQRLIGRSLRSVVNPELFPDHTFWVDCDVIQADGGTRTAAITGAWVALHDAFMTLVNEGEMEEKPMKEHIAALSVGMVSGDLCLDLCFEEDYHADVDLNLVADERGDIIEIQGTAEGDPVSRATIEDMIDLGLTGIKDLIAYQRKLVSEDG
ncbi:MAG: ribonuclease PH [Actinobacteria bacterium]|nr:ribonuclease PH [Actinomycetota bacterium]